jgi:hypothetical protein
MPDLDYAPAGVNDDEEEELKKQGILYPPAVPAPRTATDPTPPPLDPSVGAPPPGGVAPAMPVSSAPQPDFGTAMANTIGAPPNPKDYQPAKPTIGKRIAMGMAAFGGPATGRIAEENIYERPAQQAQQQYAAAENAYRNKFTDTMAMQKEQREQGTANATTNEANARADALRNPPPKQGATPEETTLHDLMTGNNGSPRINPDTQKPYQYLEAYGAVNQAKTDTKAPKAGDDLEKFYQQGVAEKRWPDSTKGREAAEAAFTGAKRNPEAGAEKANARDDREYQYAQTAITNLRKPIADRAERFSRLADTMDQGTPQSDALVAPELLSVMAGGQASGLRMNQAEIERIVGGRTKWEDLKAKIDAWQLDPSKGFALTPAQRTQVKALMNAAGGRIQKKIDIIDDANEQLSTAGPGDYRRILSETTKKLDQADKPTKEGSGGKITIDEARDYLKKAGGDKVKARELAKKDGREF